MKQTFINNIQQLMTANENQRIKITYLQTQKQKRQEYLSGLKQSIMLNKQTLIVLNNEGPNSQAIDHSSKENLHLIRMNENTYNENRSLNAFLLMEQQLRVEDKSFYLERINQFENRISDLRKYLHDKEESFSNVVLRLKKYEEWNQKPLSEKIQDTEGLRKMTNQVVTHLTSQKNMFKTKFQEVFPDAHRYRVFQTAIKNKTNLSRYINDLNTWQKSQIPVLSQGHLPKPQLIQLQQWQKRKQSIPNKYASSSLTATSTLKASQINKQLMRLLKKQKLNNQILESALHNAIQKNEELLKINQNLQLALNMVEKRMQKLIAQNNFCKIKMKQFNTGYGKRYCQNRVKDQLDQPGYLDLFKLTFQMKDEQNQEVSISVYRNLLKQSLKQDIERLLRIPLRPLKVLQASNNSRNQQLKHMNQMTTNDMTRLNQKLKNQNHSIQTLQKSTHNSNDSKVMEYQRKFMIKSASQPRIVMQWQEEDNQKQQESEQMVIEEF